MTEFLPQVIRTVGKEKDVDDTKTVVFGLEQMSFEIVQYDSKYQRALVDLWKKCDLVVPSNDPVEDIKKKLEFQPQLLFVALLDGQLMGSVMAGYEGHRGWLNYLAVLPSF